jgi:hypothetical protein
VSFISKFVADSKKGHAGVRRRASGRRAQGGRSRASAAQCGRSREGLEEDKKLLERAAGEIESLQAERGQMADVLKWPRLHNLLLHTSPSP